MLTPSLRTHQLALSWNPWNQWLFLCSSASLAGDTAIGYMVLNSTSAHRPPPWTCDVPGSGIPSTVYVSWKSSAVGVHRGSPTPAVLGDKAGIETWPKHIYFLSRCSISLGNPKTESLHISLGTLEDAMSRVPWPSVLGLRRADSGLVLKKHVKFIKVIGHLFLWVLFWESCWRQTWFGS